MILGKDKEAYYGPTVKIKSGVHWDIQTVTDNEPLQFFRINPIPAKVTFMVNSAKLIILDTQSSFRDIAIALSFCHIKHRVVFQEGPELEFMGGEFVDFLNQQLITTPCVKGLIFQPLVSFDFQFTFKDIDYLAKIYKTKFQLSLYGDFYS